MKLNAKRTVFQLRHVPTGLYWTGGWYKNPKKSLLESVFEESGRLYQGKNGLKNSMNYIDDTYHKELKELFNECKIVEFELSLKEV